MAAIKIEKGTPPKRSEQKDFPFEKLKINENFFVSVDGYKSVQSLASLLLTYSYRHKSKGQEYRTQQEKGGVRIWRTK